MISVEIQFVLINILKFFLQKFTHKLQPVQKAIQIRQRRKRIIRLKLNYIKIYINTHTYKKRNSYLSAYCNHKTKTNKKTIVLQRALHKYTGNSYEPILIEQPRRTYPSLRRVQIGQEIQSIRNQQQFTTVLIGNLKTNPDHG